MSSQTAAKKFLRAKRTEETFRVNMVAHRIMLISVSYKLWGTRGDFSRLTIMHTVIIKLTPINTLSVHQKNPIYVTNLFQSN